MKDTVITGKRKKTEIITWLVCFLIANIVNVYSIVAYHTSFVELFTSIGYVTVAACILYVVWTVLRFLFYGATILLKKK